MARLLKITQVKGGSKAKPKQKLTMQALGLRGIGTTVIRKDLRAIRGMVHLLQHLVTAELHTGSASKPAKTKKKSYTVG